MTVRVLTVQILKWSQGFVILTKSLPRNHSELDFMKYDHYFISLTLEIIAEMT